MNDFITRLSELWEAAELGEVEKDQAATPASNFPHWIFPTSRGRKHPPDPILMFFGSNDGPLVHARRDLLVLMINSMPGILEVLKKADDLVNDTVWVEDEHEAKILGAFRTAYWALEEKAP